MNVVTYKDRQRNQCSEISNDEENICTKFLAKLINKLLLVIVIEYNASRTYNYGN